MSLEAVRVDQNPAKLKNPANLQTTALAVMLGLVAWLTFAQTRALRDAHQMVNESREAAERADRICRQSAMITITVRELRDEIMRRDREQQSQRNSLAMHEAAEVTEAVAACD